MRPRHARMILLGLILPITVYFCVTQEITISENSGLFTSGKTVPLGLAVLDAIAILGVIVGLVAAAAALGYLTIVACMKDEDR